LRRSRAHGGQGRGARGVAREAHAQVPRPVTGWPVHERTERVAGRGAPAGGGGGAPPPAPPPPPPPPPARAAPPRRPPPPPRPPRPRPHLRRRGGSRLGGAPPATGPAPPRAP